MSEHLTSEMLQRAVQGELPPDRESALHEHVESCAECATAMERLAGVQRIESEAQASLRPDAIGDFVPCRDFDYSAADFVVEHLEPSESTESLGRLGGYEVLEIIGRGGMGVVLKGYDFELKRFVAIKALAPHLSQNPLARKRFSREAQAAAAVVNPHVIAIHQVQSTGKLPFLVMPLLTGESLAQRLKTRGLLELKEVLRIGIQAAEGLAAAHEQGLVHRDVKPANILLEKGVERAVLTDFGLARTADDVSMTRMGVIAGTPEYMSPEQARGESIDARSDLFSLGCVLYEMATGVSPFRTETPMASLRRIVDEAPRSIASQNPELPRWFVLIVERLLEKEPARRFESAAEVSELLAGCLAHVQQPATVALPEADWLLEQYDHSAKSIRTTLGSRRGWFAGGLFAFMVLIGGGAFFGLLGISEKDAKNQSEKNLARISAALESYRQAHDDRFPPSAIAGRDGKGGPLHSWRVAILPYLGYQKLHDAYRFDEPWDSTHNKSLLSQMPGVFRSPFDDSTNASYFGVTLAGHSQPQAITLGEPAPTGGSSPQTEPPALEQTEFVRSILKEKPSEVTLNINPFEVRNVIRQADRQWLQDLIEAAEKSVKVARDQGKPWVTAELILYQAVARLAEMDGRSDEQLKQLQIVRVLFDLLAQQTKNGEYVLLTKEATELLLRPRLAEIHTRIATLKNDLREQTLCLEDWVAVQGELVKKARDAHVDPQIAERERQQVVRWLEAARAAKDQLFEGRTVFSGSQGTQYGSIGDGAANTIAIIEAKREIPWTKPEDVVFDPRSEALQIGGWYRSGWYAAFADASVRWFPSETDHADVRNLLTILDSDGGSGKASSGKDRTFVGNPVEVTGTTKGHVWGTGIYTADSSLDAAAVHAGVVTVGETRKIFIEVVEAPSTYEGSTRNGVTSMQYGSYPTAIKLHQTRPPVETLTRSTLTFDRSPSMRRDPSRSGVSTRPETQVGETTIVELTGTTNGNVWGTDIYTGDSDITTAAVHAGLAEVGQKRWIGIVVVESPRRFAGSERNGVTSMPYDDFPTAIRLFDITLRAEGKSRFPTIGNLPLPGVPTPGGLVELFEDKPGAVVVTEVKGSVSGQVWGTDIYTGDSQIAAAAVHAGLLKVDETGWICRESVVTPTRFEGTTRNGVTTQPFDAYPTAFKLRRVTGPAPLYRLRDYQSPNSQGLIHFVGDPMVYIAPDGLGSVERVRPLGFSEKPGTRIVVEVRGSTTGTVWGTDVYTADSDMATAAVHAGLLKPDEVGWISREVVPTQKLYRGTARNGVTSLDFGEYPTAIKLARVEPPVQKSSNDRSTRRASSLPPFGDRIGLRVLMLVEGENGGRVWGSDVYTGDSHIGTAAVHAGLLEVGQVAWISCDWVPTPKRFDGTTRNGVESMLFGEWPNAFKLRRVAIGPPLNTGIHEAPSRVSLDRARNPISFADMIGTRVALKVTGAAEGSLWGDSTYSADSNIAVAAVHAGLIKVGETQWIVREAVPSPSYFAGTSRNGVRSLSHPNYPVAMQLSPLLSLSSELRSSATGPIPVANLEEIADQVHTQIILDVTGTESETIWGTDIYTADSPIGAAAVHAGLLKVGETGRLICESVPAPAQFEGSTRHGIQSQPLAKFDIAYRLKLASTPTKTATEKTSALLNQPPRVDNTDRVGVIHVVSDSPPVILTDDLLSDIREPFLRRAGDTPVARKLFDRVADDAHRVAVLRESITKPETRSRLYADELWRVWREAARAKQDGGVPAVDAALCFYLGCDPVTAKSLSEFPAPPDANEGFRAHETMLISTAVIGEIFRPETRDPFDNLIAQWTACRADPFVRQHSIEIARTHHLKAMVPVVRAMSSDAAFEPRFRATAITLLAELGGRPEIPSLCKLLDDTSECYSRLLSIKGEEAPTAKAQVRDIALGCLLVLAGEPIGEAGIDEHNWHKPPQPFTLSELFRMAPFGYFSAETRKSAHAKWDDKLRKQSLTQADPAEPTTLPLPAKPVSVQLRIAAPAAMKVEVAELDAPFDPAGKLVAPARLKCLTGKTYRLRLTEIAGRPGLELHPQIELLNAAEPLRAAGISLEAIPIEFTDEDFDVSQVNQPKIKLVMLTKSSDGTPSSVESKLHTRLEDIEQSRPPGTIPLCIIRLRHHDAPPREPPQ